MERIYSGFYSSQTPKFFFGNERDFVNILCDIKSQQQK